MVEICFWVESVKNALKTKNCLSLNERTRRVNVQYEQTPFVNRETDGMLKQENRKADGRLVFLVSIFHTFGALRKEYSLDFLFLLYQDKRKRKNYGTGSARLGYMHNK